MPEMSPDCGVTMSEMPPSHLTVVLELGPCPCHPYALP